MARYAGRKTFRLNNLTGGINSISEDNTLMSFSSQGGVAEARDIENMLPLNRGGWSQTKGFSTYFSTGSATRISGLYRFIQSDGTNEFLFSQGTQVKKLTGTPLAATSIGATISSATYPHFETAMDKLVICDGVSAPVVYDGTSTTALAGPPPVGASMSLFYQNRLWFPKGNLVYYSNPSIIDAGYGTQFVPCNINDGQKIVGISKFFIPGQLQPIIFVQKTKSSGIITGDGTTESPYFYVETRRDIGGTSFRGAIQLAQDIAYLTPQGVTSYKTDNSITNLVDNFISEKVRDKFQSLDPTYLKDSIAFYDWRNTRIGFAVPEFGKTTPNVIWFFDTRLAAWYKERWNTGQDCTASFVDDDGSWYHGDSNGNIYLHDNSYQFNGTGIKFYYLTGYMDFGDPNMYKHIVQARMMVRGNGQYPISITNNQNYGIRTGRPTTLNLTGGLYKWGGGQWNNTGIYKWGKGAVNFPKFFPGGDFQTIQFKIAGQDINNDLSIFELEFITQFTGLY